MRYPLRVRDCNDAPGVPRRTRCGKSTLAHRNVMQLIILLILATLIFPVCQPNAYIPSRILRTHTDTPLPFVRRNKSLSKIDLWRILERKTTPGAYFRAKKTVSYLP